MTSWFKKLLPSSVRSAPHIDKRGVPEGVWTKCPGCQAVLFREEYKRHLCVCIKCGHHGYLSSRDRLRAFFDAQPEMVPIAFSVPNVDKLRFKDTKKYKDRLYQAQQMTQEKDTLLAMRGHLLGRPVVAVAFDFHFIGGSMGAMTGEGFVQAVQHSLTHRLPFVCFASSGGARMQEGLVSLLQMAKTSAALAQLAKAGLPFISVLTHPTMGGVSASLGFLGDIIIGEPGALIGFAGPRVIAQTVKETLPEGFQRSEFLLEKGAIDCVLPRGVLRERIANMVNILLPQQAMSAAEKTDTGPVEIV